MTETQELELIINDAQWRMETATTEAAKRFNQHIIDLAQAKIAELNAN